MLQLNLIVRATAKVDIPKPKAWPPPKDGERIRELLEYGQKRDPVGDKLHTAFACLFMFCLPLATAPTSISMALLFGYSLLRLPSTWRTLTPIVNSTIFRIMLAWVAWSLLSITWSLNLAAGLDHANAFRMVLLPVVLWPMMRHWKYLLLAYLAGVLLQNMVQLSQVIESWFLDGTDWLNDSTLSSLSGWERHTGKAAMFMGFASLVWIGIIATNKRHRKKATICLFLSATGMFATASMAVAVGFVAAIFMLSTIVVCTKLVSTKQVLITSTTSALFALVAGFFVQNMVILKTESAIQGIRDFYDGKVDAGNSTQLRLHWWTETLKQTLDDPAVLHGLVGHGLGSVASIEFSKEGSVVKPLAEHVHVHNSYIQIFYEQGLIGIVLFLLLLWKMFIPVIKTTVPNNGYMYPICASCVVLWSVATFFENSQSSGRPLAMLVLLALFIMYQSVNEGTEKS